MTIADKALNQKRPRRIYHGVSFPGRQRYYPSPVDWREAMLNFLIIDRFSDAKEERRPLLDRRCLQDAPPKLPNGVSWRWDLWAESGGARIKMLRLTRIFPISYISLLTLNLAKFGFKRSKSFPCADHSFLNYSSLLSSPISCPISIQAQAQITASNARIKSPLSKK